MIVTKSLDNMIANEEASAFTDSKVNKSNGFDSSETSEIICYLVLCVMDKLYRLVLWFNLTFVIN